MAERSGATVMAKKENEWKVVQFPLANTDFITSLYMTINIYKQCKIAGKADKGNGGVHTLKMTGAQSWSDINLRVIKMRGKLLVTSLWNYIMLWVNEE